MKFYLAARYDRRVELCAYREDLKSLRFDVTSRWLDGAHEQKDGDILDDSNRELAEVCAWQDLEDIGGAEVFVLFSEHGGSVRGGRHVEFGYAIARSRRTGYPVFVVGPVENIFHRLVDVVVFENWPAALAHFNEAYGAEA